METRKIEALRDLAIAHYPKAIKMRADAMKYQGGMWADSGLMNALMFEDYAATAVVKQARELLQLTFMHPDARPFQPLDWDGAEADEARMVEQVREVQPQLEASMLDAARLLCELSGVALPPWVDAAPKATSAPGAKAGTNKKKWGDAELRALWEESILPGVTQTSLATKHGVKRQRIAALLKTAKGKFSTTRTSSGVKNSYGQLIK